MSEQSSLLARWWNRLRGRPVPAEARLARRPVRLASESRPLPRREERRSGIEPLEGRIAPAALLAGGRDVSYTDLDGDKVVIHLSTPIFAGLTGTALTTALDKVFVFSVADTNHDGSVMQGLQRIDLKLAPLSDTLANKASGLSLSIQVATPAPGSDGHANVGAIEADNLSLGAISVQGDLGHINAGSNGAAMALQSLSTISLGQVKTSQAGTPSYVSTIKGGLGTATFGSITDAFLNLTTGTAVNGKIIAVGNLGTLVVGSSATPNADALIGGTAVDTGTIIAAGNIGAIRVFGNLHGGDGGKSGAISCGGSIGSAVVTGKLLGGVGDFSAVIQAGRSIGPTTIGGGVGDVMAAGTGASSASILAGGDMGPIVVRGNIVGGGQQSGRIESDGLLSSITVMGDVVGGVGAQSGLLGGGSIGSVNITGQLRGGAGSTSGEVAAAFGGLGNISTVTIAKGMIGGDGDVSGSVNVTGSIGSITVGANPATGAAMQGGNGQGSAVIDANGSIGTVILRGNIQGIGDTADPTTHLPSGKGDQSTGISAGRYLGDVRVLGSLLGSPTALHSGYIEAELGINSVGVTGPVEGGGIHSGVIASGGSLNAVTVGGHLQGGASAYSGSIVSGFGGTGTLGAAVVLGGITGGAGNNSGSINSASSLGTVRVFLPTGAETVALKGGGGAYSGSIYAANGIGSVGIAGGMAGGSGANSGSIEGHGTVTAIGVNSILGGGGPASGTVRVDDLFIGSSVRLAYLGSLQTGAITGGAGINSGSVLSESNLGTITASELARGTEATSGSIRTGLGLFGTGGAQALNLAHVGRAGGTLGGSLEIHGSLTALTATEISNGLIRAETIGTLTSGTIDSTTITALGHPGLTSGTDLALARLVVTGSLTRSNILAGYDFDGSAANGHAQIGAVTVLGDWAATNLIAGVSNPHGDGTVFGSADDAAIPLATASSLRSSIGSVVIRGSLAGGTTAQTYAFEAEQIGAFQYGTKQLPLTAANEEHFDNEAAHVVIREIHLPTAG